MKELLKEARDLLVMCTLIDKSGQCEDMVNKIDKALEELNSLFCNCGTRSNELDVNGRCPSCGKKLNPLTTYSFECKVCGKSFQDTDSLYEHYDEEHNKPKQ